MHKVLDLELALSFKLPQSRIQGDANREETSADIGTAVVSPVGLG